MCTLICTPRAFLFQSKLSLSYSVKGVNAKRRVEGCQREICLCMDGHTLQSEYSIHRAKERHDAMSLWFIVVASFTTHTESHKLTTIRNKEIAI